MQQPWSVQYHAGPRSDQVPLSHFLSPEGTLKVHCGSFLPSVVSGAGAAQVLARTCPSPSSNRHKHKHKHKQKSTPHLGSVQLGIPSLPLERHRALRKTHTPTTFSVFHKLSQSLARSFPITYNPLPETLPCHASPSPKNSLEHKNYFHTLRPVVLPIPHTQHHGQPHLPGSDQPQSPHSSTDSARSLLRRLWLYLPSRLDLPTGTYPIYWNTPYMPTYTPNPYN